MFVLINYFAIILGNSLDFLYTYVIEGLFICGACNHWIGPERTGSEVITGSDLIFH